MGTGLFTVQEISASGGLACLTSLGGTAVCRTGQTDLVWRVLQSASLQSRGTAVCRTGQTDLGWRVPQSTVRPSDIARNEKSI